MENIELSEMLGQLREELLKARGQSQGSELKFQVEDIEIELQDVATKGGGVKCWVYNAEVNASQARTQINRWGNSPDSAGTGAAGKRL